MTVASVSRRSASLPLFGLLVVLIIGLDQITKYLCSTYLGYAEIWPVFPGFDLLLVHNSGAAFSFLDQASGWQRWILSAISLGVSIGIATWLYRVPRQQVLLAVALSMILAGALGNLYDRVMLGYVVDFISVYAGSWRFATFNVADAAISTGAALLALDVVLGREKNDKRET